MLTLRKLITGVFFLFIAMPFHLAGAAEFTPNIFTDAVDSNPGDGNCLTAAGNCSLRAAIQESIALTNEDHTITLSSGTYQLSVTGRDEDLSASGDFDITNDITINGEGATNTIINGGTIDRIFHVFSGKRLTLNQVSLTNAEVKILNTDGVYTDGGFGGAIFNQGGWLYINDSWIYNNTAFGQGGGISSFFGHVELENTLVYANVSSSGAGIALANNTTHIRDSYIMHNPDIANAALDSFLGGGIFNYGDLTISDSLIYNNKAEMDGAGLYHLLGELRVQNTTFNNNYAGRNGGGIYYRMGSFGSNKGDGPTARPVLTNVTITNNAARGFESVGEPFTTFTPAEGSFVFPNGEPIDFSIPTGASDGAIGGGGIFVAGQVEEPNGQTYMAIVNSLIADNYSNFPVNSSTPISDCDSTTAGFINSLGNNIDTAGGCDLLHTSDQSNVDLALEPFQAPGVAPAGLTNYDGTPPALTQSEFDTLAPTVHRFQMTSAAVDTGNNSQCPSTDQRGRLRTDGLCDIGAFELLGPLANPMVYVTQPSGVVEGVFSVSDAGTNTLTFEITSPPSQGSAGLDGEPAAAVGAWIYTANPDASGADQFDFEVCLDNGLCSSATISINFVTGTAVTEAVSIEVIEGTGTTTDVAIVNETSLAAEVADTDYTFPLGAFFFSVEDVSSNQPDDSLTLVLQLPLDTNIPTDAVVRKMDNTGQWQTLSNVASPTESYATLNAIDKTITLTLYDNDIFDSNPTVGVIRDPVALAIPDQTIVDDIKTPELNNNYQPVEAAEDKITDADQASADTGASDNGSGGSLNLFVLIFTALTLLFIRRFR